MRHAVSILLFICIQCHLKGELSVAERDRAQFEANTVRKGANQSTFGVTNPPPFVASIAVKSPLMLLSLFPGSDDDCGACNTNPTIINPAFQQSFSIEFDTSEPVNVIGIDKSTNGITWATVYLEQPHLWIGLGHRKIRITNSEPWAFYRVFVRNEP